MFIFTDWDDKDPSAELDIKGERYERLIEVCFRFCSYFSLNENRLGGVPDLPELVMKNQLSLSSDPKGKTHLFFCSSEAKQLLLQKVDSIFSWFTWDGTPNQEGGVLPEDLCFYRKDGSLFFWSQTHEGICILCPRPEEDVSGLLSMEGWREIHDGDISGLASLENFNLFI